ncbi:MAG: cupin domain-containing protein [Planctomycetota bacterium]
MIKHLKECIQFSPDKLKKINLFETEHFFCDIYCLKPGQQQKSHEHTREDKIYFVLKGHGTAQLGDTTHPIQEGDCIFAQRQVLHGIQNETCDELILLVFMAPNPNKK